MAPPDLQGFYFDPEKNRYFPISHQRRARDQPEASDAASTNKNKQCAQPKKTTADRVLALIHQREVFGNRRYGQLRSTIIPFQQEYLERQTFHLGGRKYGLSPNVSDGGIELMRFGLLTAEGETEGDMLTTGGASGGLRMIHILKEQDWKYPRFQLNRLIPAEVDVYDGEVQEAPGMRSINSAILPSKITSVKGVNNWLRSSYPHRQQGILIATLGDAAGGGSLYLLFQNPHSLSMHLELVFPTAHTVWTSESHPNKNSASLGMSSGVRLVDLERGSAQWVCHCSSDVLSQQFDSTGNILLCGFRNGVISTIDLRLPEPRARRSEMYDSSTNKRTSSKGITKHGRPRSSSKAKSGFRLFDDSFCSHAPVMQMESAVCSLQLLRSSEWYLLASSMNGDIEMWDRRFVGKGALRYYDGHVNTHTILQLGLDPGENYFVSGGEDGIVRLWSVSSGKLISQLQGISSPAHPATAVTWRRSVGASNANQWGRFCKDPIFNEEDAVGLWMGNASGLIHIYGSAR